MRNPSVRLMAMIAILLVTSTVASAQRRERLPAQTFDSGGVDISYVIKGEGDPVVLIHGFSANWIQNWQAPGVMDDLSDDFQVIAIDNRGHGRSGKPHDPDAYGPEMVQDIVRLLDHLGIERAHIVGYSMGGFITMKLISKHPDRIISAVVGGAGWNREGDERMDFVEELATSLEEGRGITPLIRRLNPEGRPLPSDQELQAMNTMVMLGNDPLALAAVIRGMKQFTVTEEELRANKVPTLAVVGGDDPLRVGTDEMADIMGNLEVVIVEGEDHMTAMRHEEFRGAIEDFLKRHATQQAAEPVGAASE